LAIGLLLSAGCAGHRFAIDKALRTPDAPGMTRDLGPRYLVYYPDTVEVRVASRPDCSGAHQVGLDGSIWLTSTVDVSASGLPVTTISRYVARRLGVDEREVSVQVSNHQSQQVFLVGPTGAIQRALPYHGPETVVELLRRAGELKGADLRNVRVVRSHVADGKPPEVFEVDLYDILVRKKTKTNVRLEPSDHIQVGQAGPERMCTWLPPWLKPAWRKMTLPE
jgi:protein involved in polysaccharide export with SLBB domain